MSDKQVKQNPTQEDRIQAEVARLNKVLAVLPENKKNLAKGLIESAAFMKVTLVDMEKDISAKGCVEAFQQSVAIAPYARIRPVAQLYNTVNKNYQTTIKQLNDMLPKEETEHFSRLNLF